MLNVDTSIQHDLHLNLCEGFGSGRGGVGGGAREDSLTKL